MYIGSCLIFWLEKYIGVGKSMENAGENTVKDVFEQESREMMKQAAKSGGTTIAEHNHALLDRARVLFELHYISYEIYELLCKACEYHDLGKANPRMQERLKSNKLKFDAKQEIPHNVLSMYLMPKDTSPEYYMVLFAVGFHHDYGDVFRLLEDPEKRRLAEELLAQWECAKHPGRKAIKTIQKYITQTEIKDKMILIKGLLHKCDYAASGETEIEYVNHFLMHKMKQFFEGKGYSYNDMQRFCMERQDENIMLVGQTGMGKTEAALLWIGNHKGFIFLPVRTAINKMYDRIGREIIDDESSDGIEKQLGLLHSDAVSRLLEQQEKEAQSKENIEGIACQEMDVLAYYNRSRQLAMPLTISTVDQLFDFIFQYQTYELKLATLSYSKIVIDEIQMYGADLLADLVFGLKMIRRLGGRIAIATATLAPFVKELIEEEVGKFECGVFCDRKQVRHKVKIMPVLMDTEAILEKFFKCLSVESETEVMSENRRLETREPSGKILVICNTIKKAQQMYNELCEQVGEGNKDRVHLLHSKFIHQDRVRKENDICECGVTEHQETVIWISTSLVEASLDIDFDYLFTELQDIPSLLQRMGRVNRKGKKTVYDCNCFVYTVIEEKYLELSYASGRNQKETTTAFIDRDIFELSKLALEQTLKQEKEEMLSEGCKIDMMDQYFTTKRLSNTNYMQKYRKQMEKLKGIVLYEMDRKEIKIREDIFTKDVIPISVYESCQQEIEFSAKKIRSSNTGMLEKMKERNRIMQYTVPVQNYIVDDYKKAVCKGLSAKECRPVKIGAYEKIVVVDCDYDDRIGFRAKKFEKVEEPIFV